VGLLLRAGDRRLLRERGLGLRSQRVHGCARTLDERARQLLVEEREHEVLGVHLGIAAPSGELARRGNGLL
jgi:hypothetical protein